MRFLIIFVILFFSSCSVEDENADKFRVKCEISWGLFGGKKIDGSVTKIQSTPHTTITLRLELLNANQDCVDYEYVTVSGVERMNERYDFCELLPDSIESVDYTITEVR